MEVKRPVDKIRAIFPCDPMLAKNSREPGVRSGQPAEALGARGRAGLSPSCSAAQHTGAQCGCGIPGTRVCAEKSPTSVMGSYSSWSLLGATVGPDNRGGEISEKEAAHGAL